MGRPSSFNQEIADKICEIISTSSKSLRTICQAENMPCVATVLNWLAQGDNPDADPVFKSFLAQYARAKEEQADFLAEEMMEIADNKTDDKEKFGVGAAVVNRARLQVDTRKWIASKLKPKKYGDRLDLNHEGGQTIVVKFQDD